MTAFVIEYNGVFTDSTLPTLRNFILDNFVTADRPVEVAHDGDVAAPWNLYNSSSAWAVVSGGARPTVSSASRQIIAISAGDSDGEIVTSVTSLGSGMAGSGIVFRFVSATDYCMVKYVVGPGYVVSRELNGVSTVVGSIAAVAAVGDTVTVRFVGTALTLTVNGLTPIDIVFSFNVEASIHGLASLWTSTNSPKFGKFSFTSANDL